nr:unnamed protein product [Callosobruchus chinensis]
MKSLQMLSVPLQAMQAKIELVEELLDKPSEKKARNDLKAIQEISTPLSKLQENLKQMQIKSVDLGTSPQQAVLSILEVENPLSEISATIEQLKSSCEEATIDISPEQQETLASLKEPLQKLAVTIAKSTELLSKPKTLELEKPKMMQAVIGLKEQLQKVSMDIPKMETVRALSIPINEMKAAIAQVETSLGTIIQPRNDVESLKQLIIPVEHLKTKIAKFHDKIKSIPQHAIFAAAELEEPLRNLSCSILKLEKVCVETVTDITTEQSKILTDLTDPLQVFSSVIQQIESVAGNPAQLDQLKPKVAESALVLNEQLQLIIDILPQAQSLQSLDIDLASLSSAIEHIQSQMAVKTEKIATGEALNVLRQLKLPVAQLQEEMKIMNLNIDKLSENDLIICSLKSPLDELAASVAKIEKDILIKPENIPSEFLCLLENSVPPLEDMLIEFVKINSRLEKDVPSEDYASFLKTVSRLQDKLQPVLLQPIENKTIEEFMIPLQSLAEQLSLVKDKLVSVVHLERQKLASSVLGPFASVKNELADMKVDLTILPMPVHNAVLTMTKLDEPFTELLAILEKNISESEELSTLVKDTTESLKTALNKVESDIKTIKSVMSSAELTLLELPVLCSDMKMVKESLKRVDAEGIFSKLKIAVQTKNMEHIVCQLIEECNKERLDFKSVANLQASLNNLQTSLSNLMSKKKDFKVMNEENILLLDKLQVPVKQLIENTVLAQDIGDNTNDFSADYVSKIDNLSDTFTMLNIFIDDVCKEPNMLKDIPPYENQLCSMLYTISDALREVSESVKLNDKIEVLSQATKIFENTARDLFSTLEEKAIQKREDIKFLSELMKEVDNLKPLLSKAKTPLNRLSKTFSTVGESILDARRYIAAEKLDDLPQNISTNLVLARNIKTFLSEIEKVTPENSEDNKNAILYALTNLNQNIQSSRSLIDGIKSIDSLNVSLVVLYEDVSALIDEIKEENQAIEDKTEMEKNDAEEKGSL